MELKFGGCIAMDNLSKKQKKEMLDLFGEKIIEKRDYSLHVAMSTVKQTTTNPADLGKYDSLLRLSNEQKEAVCDLLSETITNTIYNVLEMFEENDEMMKLSLIHEKKEYNMIEVSEKMGSEIACYDEDEGWIQRFSEIGRFVL